MKPLKLNKESIINMVILALIILEGISKLISIITKRKYIDEIQRVAKSIMIAKYFLSYHSYQL